MTPERWRAVDAILQAALACEPARRDAFVAEACADDQWLRREVESLLAAHGRTNDDFLERPAAHALGMAGAHAPLEDRLAAALTGRYHVERELARGGMATVYLARDLRHDRRVAIKVLQEELAAAVGAERFLEEIRVTASLQHPHILPLFDSGNADGVLWYVMPFVEGETLRSRLAREGRLPVDVALRLAREMADALEYAHRQGVVHRDVKPENVLLQSGHALVADFGIALALEHAGGDRLTRTGITLGTPQYMAPEQASGDGNVDARTDVYALGAVLHEMLAGESPFAAASRHGVLRRVLIEPPVALATRRADVSAFLDATVRRALAKRPDDRFPSAAAFAAVLGTASAGTAPESSPPGRALHADARDESSRLTQSQTTQGRRVSARAAMYAAGVMLVIGIAVGVGIARWSVIAGWTTPAIAPAPSQAVVTQPIGGTVSPIEGTTLAVVDRAGHTLRTITATRPWTPRISPDGRSVAYGAFGAGRSTSDLWVTDLGTGTTRRLTDDDGDSNDPQWSPDGKSIAYSASADGGKDLMVTSVEGGDARLLAARVGVQFPSDWLRDRSALLVTDNDGSNAHDILAQPADGSSPRPYVATSADETTARVSPDGRWVAYTSDESGREEVYLDSYPTAGRRVALSTTGGVHPVWRGDGRELYFWSGEALMAVQLGPSSGAAPPTIGSRSILLHSSYAGGVNTMYDVSPDGQKFVIVANYRKGR
jgi:eukaryotic-like serine/threonine-protein kinase